MYILVNQKYYRSEKEVVCLCARAPNKPTGHIDVVIALTQEVPPMSTDTNIIIMPFQRQTQYLLQSCHQSVWRKMSNSTKRDVHAASVIWPSPYGHSTTSTYVMLMVITGHKPQLDLI